MTGTETRRGRRASDALPPSHRRRWLAITVAAVLVGVGLVVGGPWVYAQFLLREAPEPLTLSTPSRSPETPVGPVDVNGTWEVAEGSEAGYRLGEVLSGQPVTVVGRTEEVTGRVVVAQDALTEARVVVDAGSITTDESARDAYFRRALDTTNHPEAVFELAQPVDVSALRTAEGPVEIAVPGTVTFHGVSRPATATLQAQRTGTGVELAGQIPVTLADFDLTAPDLGWVVVEPTGAIEVRLELARGDGA